MTSLHSTSPILLVEDDTFVLSALATTLEAEGFNVVPCPSPVEALRLISRREFALIISDQRMPEMTGLAFFAECRKLCPGTPRILLTAVVELSSVMAAINQGGEICRFMSKPWRREELVTAVRAAVQRHDLSVRRYAS
jgi:DNA-binding NtrC family response regulator